MIADFQPEILMQAVAYTAIMFGSFTGVALFSQRRSYLFLGSIIVTIVNAMFFYRTFAWLMGYSVFGMGYLLLGLLICCMYVIFDTQIIVEQAERGDKDVPT